MIPLMKNAFIEEEKTRKELSQFVLTTKQFSMGIECEKFENKFSHKQESKYSILFNSGASANLALLQALLNMGKIKKGDKIGFSALTWSTNIMPIIQLGLNPIPIDCNINTLNVSPQNLLQTLQDHKIQVLFITNVLGFIDNLEEIQQICNTNGILLLEDNCESLGTITKNGNKTGNFGLASTFSFYVAHHMSTIEGGMVCTNDLDLSQMLKLVRANGWDRNLDDNHKNYYRQKFQIETEFKSKYTFYDLAFNFRPTEITGFLGSLQIEYLDQNISIREKIFNKIHEVIKTNDDLISLDNSHLKITSTFAIPIICKNSIIRDKYLMRFQNANIEVRPIIAGNMQNQPFYHKYVSLFLNLSNSDFLDKNGFYCGNYPELTESDITLIINCLKK